MLFRDKIIMSAERYELSETENADRTMQLKEALDREGLKYRIGLGVYNGVREVSFLIDDASTHLNKLFSLADKRFNQESILVTDNFGAVAIMFCGTNLSEELGFMKQLTAREVIGEVAYSMFDGKFYKAVKNEQ